MTRYQLSEQKNDGQTIYVLKDAEYPAEAYLVPEIGNNLFRFTVKGEEVLIYPEQVAMIKEASARYGIPILFPPNKVRKGTFSFQGKQYQLGLNKGEHHSHGELRVRPWKVVAKGATADRGAFVMSEFDFNDHPDLLHAFQSRLVFRFTYSLFEGELTLTGEVTNHGSETAPFTLGFHPYFTVSPENQQQTTMKVASQSEWTVNREGFVEGEPLATPLCERLTNGLAYTEMPSDKDHAFVTLQAGTTSCEIQDHTKKRTIVYHFGDHFPYMIVFKPEWNSSLSLEPYTAVTDAFNLPLPADITGARGLDLQKPFHFMHKISVVEE
ncbi:aldose 1-epimerase [Brevibacillus daliensis]|uniref:aldose 1-epimerase n=1 Tax=Brevibacillus daliensis TaxID=2892995 RepID=UPI001E329BD4|nr:aldose 1-epimerase [Brevibacillus daliensis]